MLIQDVHMHYGTITSQSKLSVQAKLPQILREERGGLDWSSLKTSLGLAADKTRSICKGLNWTNHYINQQYSAKNYGNSKRYRTSHLQIFFVLLAAADFYFSLEHRDISL